MPDLNAIRSISISLTEDELRYLVSCGSALVMNVPEASLPTYTHFSKNQIIDFSRRIRSLMNFHNIDM